MNIKPQKEINHYQIKDSISLLIQSFSRFFLRENQCNNYVISDFYSSLRTTSPSSYILQNDLIFCTNSLIIYALHNICEKSHNSPFHGAILFLELAQPVFLLSFSYDALYVCFSYHLIFSIYTSSQVKALPPCILQAT